MEEQQLNYTQAFEELQFILTEIEDGTISLDDLGEKVKRASELIDICRNKLRNTEENVSKILDQLKEEKKD